MIKQTQNYQVGRDDFRYGIEMLLYRLWQLQGDETDNDPVVKNVKERTQYGKQGMTSYTQYWIAKEMVLELQGSQPKGA